MMHEDMFKRQPAHAIDQLMFAASLKEKKQKYFFARGNALKIMLNSLFLPRTLYQETLLKRIQAAHKLTNISANFTYKGRSYKRKDDAGMSKQLEKHLHVEMDGYLAEVARQNKAEVNEISNYLMSVLSKATTQKEMDILIPEVLVKEIKSFDFYRLAHLSYPDQDMEDNEKNLNAFIEKNQSSILLIKKTLTENLFYSS